LRIFARMTLADLEKGNSAEVLEIRENGVTTKLFEFGVLPGAVIEVLGQAPFNGPIYIKVEDNLIAVRKREAEQIIVK
jgi:ferrous iron transport protein A